MVKIRYRIKELRAAKSMSQQDLSKALSVRPHVISNWERGKYAPTPTHRAALCVVLGCKLSDLEVLEPAVQ